MLNDPLICGRERGLDANDWWDTYQDKSLQRSRRQSFSQVWTCHRWLCPVPLLTLSTIRICRLLVQERDKGGEETESWESWERELSLEVVLGCWCCCCVCVVCVAVLKNNQLPSCPAWARQRRGLAISIIVLFRENNKSLFLLDCCLSIIVEFCKETSKKKTLLHVYYLLLCWQPLCCLSSEIVALYAWKRANDRVSIIVAVRRCWREVRRLSVVLSLARNLNTPASDGCHD